MSNEVHIDAVPSLTGLLHLEAVTRTGSFTAAARALHITQSAVSRQIRLLEEELGVTVCERTSTGVRPTPAGLALAASMREALAQIGATRQKWCGSEEEVVQSGQVTLGMPPSLAHNWAIARLAGFRDAYPGWSLQPDVAISMHDLDAGGVDACIRYGKGGYRGVLWEKIASEQLVAVCQPELWQTLGEELTHAPMLQAHTTSSPRGEQPVRTWAAHCHVALHGPVMDFNRQSMAVMAAVHGEGVAIVPFQMVRDVLTRGELIRPVALSCPDQMSYYLVWHPEHARPHVIEMLSAWLRAELVCDT